MFHSLSTTSVIVAIADQTGSFQFFLTFFSFWIPRPSSVLFFISIKLETITFKYRDCVLLILIREL